MTGVQTCALPIYYLTGGTDTLASAALQERVKTLAEANGAAIGSLQSLGGEDQTGLRRIAIRVQLSATLPQLVGMLYGLESGMPLLFVDNLEMQGQAALMADPDAEPTSAPLTVGFDLYGFMAPEQP